MSTPTSDSALRGYYKDESDRIRRDFEGEGSGQSCTRDRAQLVDKLLLQLWAQQALLHASAGYALVALGGYGRRALYPHSDIDLLFLCEDDKSRSRAKDPVRAICQELWDSTLRVSPTTRTLDDCGRFDQENVEFTISLLDCRFLIGDERLFARLHDKVVPQLVARESGILVQRLFEVTNTRHAKFGQTIFHLEPNLKDGPGGLRDFHVTRWIALINELAANRAWPESLQVQLENDEDNVLDAMEFMSSARCYLHYRSGRDENVVSWEAQEDLAGRGIGSPDGPLSSAEWMRLYFRHARVVYRNATQVLEQTATSRSSLVRSFRRWRSGASSDEFSVVDRRAYIQQSAGARDPEVALRLFIFVARHGVKLAIETERRLNNARRALEDTMPQDARLWAYFRELLVQPYAAEALRAMHSLGLLALAVPEFETIDSLVLRDLYHRYTVDEHTFLAIDTLHQLRKNDVEWLQPFADLFLELERPELLFLALLFHDTGKGLAGSNHVHGSLQLALPAVERLGLTADDAKTVGFLISSHLEVSSTLRRRDIYDPETVRELAAKMETPERLKMLTLMTLADIKAVNPEALTPWKAENLWQLYIATANYFDRSVDEERFHATAATAQVERIAALLPKGRTQLLKFLNGLPQRYLLSYSPEQVLTHFEMSNRLRQEPVQLGLRQARDQHELIVVTKDRPGLFSTLAGILYGWGMDITKASALSNEGGIIVDSLYFKDRFRTLELNPSERERFKRSVIAILNGESPLERLLEPRLRADTKPPRLKVETRLRFDDEASPTSTLLEVTTQDRPGLLYTISSTLAEENCSIEIALIDTEGAVAHDVFYLTSTGVKLTRDLQREIEWALTTELGDSLPSSW
jgi:[protein-PII] uridylyltransferase